MEAVESIVDATTSNQLQTPSMIPTQTPEAQTLPNQVELEGPKKKPRILPGKEIDMKSREFKRQLQSVVVDGADIFAAARDTCQKSLARQEAKDAAAKAKAKKEEERVGELKRIRGERWLPSIAREMHVKSQG